MLLPAIDIKGGKCVRLFRGNFEKTTQYQISPLDQAKTFLKYGFNNIHIIDLDGALQGRSVNKSIIEDICKLKDIFIQTGGGIRSLDQIGELLDIGVHKVILGTKAIEDLNFLEHACKKYNDKIILSIDAKGGYVALSGWTKNTKINAKNFVKKIKDFNISRIVYTDIDRDGTKTGPNVEQTVSLSNITNIPFIVSGGISSIKDISDIKEKKFKNIIGVIIGKAIYDGNINLKNLASLLDE